MKIGLMYSTNNAVVTHNVNSAAYITQNAWNFLVPFSIVPYTHYRITIAGNSNAAGQSISLQITDPATPTVPIHTPGPDLTIPNVGAWYDSGWRSIDNIPAADTRLCLAYKGSNATVDLQYVNLEITFAVL